MVKSNKNQRRQETDEGETMSLLYIGLGGAVGAVSRYYVSKFFHGYRFRNFPLGTFIVNILGAFFLGVLLNRANFHVSESFVPLLGTGFLGAFTTYSTFSLDFIMLLQRKKWGIAYLYLCMTILTGLLFAWLGYNL